VSRASRAQRPLAALSSTCASSRPSRPLPNPLGAAAVPPPPPGHLRYHYYSEWMRGRIGAACPGLPEPVASALLALDAGDLDLLLQHPLGAQAQVGGGRPLLAGPGAAAACRVRATQAPRARAAAGPAPAPSPGRARRESARRPPPERARLA
jgi:hypothetical protein